MFRLSKYFRIFNLRNFLVNGNTAGDNIQESKEATNRSTEPGVLSMQNKIKREYKVNDPIAAIHLHMITE